MHQPSAAHLLLFIGAPRGAEISFSRRF